MSAETRPPDATQHSALSTQHFRLTVHLPEPLRDGHGDTLIIDQPVKTLADLVTVLEQRLPGFSTNRDELFNFAINGELLLHGEKTASLKNGDEVEIVVAFSGG